MTASFTIGDHVGWNSEAGRVSGRIIEIPGRDTSYQGHRRRCRPDDPQYEIRGDRTEHVAMHKGSALQRIA